MANVPFHGTACSIWGSQTGGNVPYHGWSNLCGGSAPFEADVLIRVIGTDWNGTSVGSGATFTATSTAPTVSGGALVFDGADDEITATVNFDLNGKTILMAAKVNSVSASGDAIWTLGGTFDEIVLRAGNTSEFRGQLRADAGVGFGSVITAAASGLNALYDQVGEDVVYVVQVTAAEANISHGDFAAGFTSVSHDNTVTSIALGRGRNSQRPGLDFYEFMVLDSVDQTIIASAVEYLRSTYSATGPYITPMLGKDVSIIGDSISVGVSATGNNSFARQLSLTFGADRTIFGFAGAQVSPIGLTSPADDDKITATFANITSDAAAVGGTPAVFCFVGVNDYASGDGVPIGTITDATDATFYGALNVGWTNFLANSDTGTPLFIFTPIYKTDETANTEGHTLEEYRAAIRTWVTDKDHALLSLVEMSGSGIGDSDLSDGLHPNDTGHGKIVTAATPQIAAYYGIVR